MSRYRVIYQFHDEERYFDTSVGPKELAPGFWLNTGLQPATGRSELCHWIPASRIIEVIRISEEAT